MHTEFWREERKGRDYLKDEGVDGMIVLKFILMK
jgi:hypothetical protein